jgi:hypothetical protein
MKTEKIKKLIIDSLERDNPAEDTLGKLEEEGVTYTFESNFRDKVIYRIFTAGININREIEFVRSLNFAFYRIALTGVAAIILLLISIFVMEGSLSFNSFLGISNNNDESIVFLLTGN